MKKQKKQQWFEGWPKGYTYENGGQEDRELTLMELIFLFIFVTIVVAIFFISTSN